MNSRIAVLGHIGDQPAAALLVDGRLDDFLIDAPTSDTSPRPGAIYRAICDRPVKGQGAMFLKLPGGARGFLRQAKGLAPGQAILVQVTGRAEAGKACPCATRVLHKSRYAIVTPGAPGLNVSRGIGDDDLRDRLTGIAHTEMAGSEHGLILRTACDGASSEDISDDIAAMRAEADAMADEVSGNQPELLIEGPDAHHMAWREWDVERADSLATDFEDHQIREHIDPFLAARVDLQGGAFMFVEPTRALVAVDVNTGADMSLAAGLKANLAMIKALPRQLRIRGLAGQITLDVAPMPKKDRKQFEHSLRAALRKDSVETVLAGWTPLGCFELQRKRERLPLRQILPAET